jgi:hypothetical protein
LETTQNYRRQESDMPIPVTARSKPWVCGCSLAGIAGSSPAGGMNVSCVCSVLSGIGLCDGLITRPEEFYRVWCVQWVWSRSPVRRGHGPQLCRSATGRVWGEEGRKRWGQSHTENPQILRTTVQDLVVRDLDIPGLEDLWVAGIALKRCYWSKV